MSSQVILLIDTSDHQRTKVRLVIDGSTYVLEAESRAQKVLPLIEALLLHHHLNLSDITEITVHPGPGSFTGLRVGIAIATTLGALLGVPVNGDLDSHIVPQYNASKFS